MVVAVDCVLRMERVVFADTDGDGVADIGSEQAPAGDAELAGQLGAREIDGVPRAVRRVVTGQNARALFSLEQKFDDEGPG